MKIELLNPFKPTEPSIYPHDFFGRQKEVKGSIRSLKKGSILIEGGVGIGKSSLQAHLGISLEGFLSNEKSIVITTVGHSGITTIDKAAASLLSSFVEVDEQSDKLRISFGKLVSLESGELIKYYQDGRNVDVLKRILEKESLKLIEEYDFLVLSVDEVSECVEAFTKLIRVLWTYLNHKHVTNVKFILTGASPLLTKMVAIDQGIIRCFYKTIKLGPLKAADASALLQDKFDYVSKDALKKGFVLTFTPQLINSLVSISGGHPHILQLLGSLLIDCLNDKEEPDLGVGDIIEILYNICHELRASEYQRVIHNIRLDSQLDDFKALLKMSDCRFPTKISILKTRSLQIKSLRYFVEKNILSVDEKHYHLLDEFLWVYLELQNIIEVSKLPSDSLLLTHLKQFGIEYGGAHNDYFLSRIGDQLYDSEKTEILLAFIQKNSSKTNALSRTEIIDELGSLFSSALAINATINDLYSNNKIEIKKNLSQDDVIYSKPG